MTRSNYFRGECRPQQPPRGSIWSSFQDQGVHHSAALLGMALSPREMPHAKFPHLSGHGPCPMTGRPGGAKARPSSPAPELSADGQDPGAILLKVILSRCSIPPSPTSLKMCLLRTLPEPPWCSFASQTLFPWNTSWLFSSKAKGFKILERSRGTYKVLEGKK